MKRLILISASLILASSAFAQSRCVSAPVSVTGSQTNITTSGAKVVTEKQTYIYYATKHRKHNRQYPIASINEKYPSRPLMVNSGKEVSPIPENYNISLNTPERSVSVCPDSAVTVTANINLEKVSSYTGNYPNSDSKTYIKVCKRDYKMAQRKMRKIERKEQKIARKSGTSVTVKSSRA